MCSERGKKDGIFHREISPVRLYLVIASLCWFPVSNRFTLSAIFDLDWGDAEFGEHAETVADIINTWLTAK